MRRTSTLQAAAAALGMLAGFAMAPAERAPLEGEVTPYAVALVWDEPTGADLPVAGVQVDDWGGRLKPAEPAVRLEPMRARPPAGRAAPARRPAPAPRHKAYRAPHPLILRQRELATLPAPRGECPREAAERALHAAHAALAHES